MVDEVALKKFCSVCDYGADCFIRGYNQNSYAEGEGECRWARVDEIPVIVSRDSVTLELPSEQPDKPKRTLQFPRENRSELIRLLRAAKGQVAR